MQSLTRDDRARVLPAMNDPIGAIRACGFLLLAACTGDPSLEVTVHHPTGFAVEQTEVTVYFGDDVRCVDIMYGDRTDSELAAITVAEVDVRDGGQIQVSRLGGKSVVARGFDADHRFVTAGCKDLGEITPGTRLPITTQPTSVIAIDPGTPERPFAERKIIVNLTDPNGAAIDGMVSWQLTGPAGAPTPDPAAGVATQRGDAQFVVQDLGVPGPEGLRIRVPWAIAPLPLVTGFDLTGAITLDLGGGNANSHPSCDVRGHAGAPATLVCLTQADAQGHRDAVEWSWQTDHYAARAIAIPASLDNQFALFVDHDGSASEPVYVISADAAGVGSWYKLEAAPGSQVAETFGGPLEAVVYVARCADNSAAAAVGVQVAGLGLIHKRRFYSATGVASPAGLVEGEVIAGGCISDVDQIEHQAVVTSVGTGDAFLSLVADSATPLLTPKLSGTGFVAVQTGGVIEHRFAGTRLQATGTVVFESVLARQGTGYKLVERTEREAAAPPNKILAGKLDRDGDTDLMWDLATNLRRHTYQVSLAEQVAGVPLTAITSGPAPTATPLVSDFLVGNLDGGVADEMIVFTQSQVTIYSAD